MKLTPARLRQLTLARQFPIIAGRTESDVVELFERLGPIQSQVPRAPFLTAASRLPGVTYATLQNTFAEQRLLKTTNLRGTVHSCVADQFRLLDAAIRPIHARDLKRVFRLEPTEVQQLVQEIEAFCQPHWQQRADLLDHVRQWLADRLPHSDHGRLDETMPANLIWGHSGLVRRPHDDHWERRTDSLHRTADQVAGLDGRPALDQQTAVTALAGIHLGSYGPATRYDIAWWIGCPLGPVDRALTELEPKLVRHTGPAGEDLVDLIEAPQPTDVDHGVRLLPEFDGLLIGYAPRNRTRFLDHDQLELIFSRDRGHFLGTVLQDDRIVGGWRTAPGRPADRTEVEIRPFRSGPRIDENRLADPIAASAEVLGWTVTDVRMLPAS